MKRTRGRQGGPSSTAGRRRPATTGFVVEVEQAAGSAPIRYRATALGPGGVFIGTPAPLPEGRPVRLRLRLPDAAGAIAIDASVVWAEPRVGMALRFTGVDPVDRAAIERAAKPKTRSGAVPAASGATRRAGRATAGPGAVGSRRAPARSGGADPLPPLPSEPPDTGTLYVTLSNDATRTSVRAFFTSAGFSYTEPVRGILAVPIARGVLRRLATEFRRCLTGTELAESKSMVVAGAVGPGLTELVRMRPLEALVTEIERGWLAAMLRDERLVAYYQPIVHAGAPEQIFGYEALARGREPDGTIIGAQQLFDTARSAQLLVVLDRFARLAAIRSAAAHGVTARLFLNVNPASIGDPDAQIEARRGAVKTSGISPDRIVLEIVESDRIGAVKPLLDALDAYRAAGFGVALDDLGAGYSSLTLLSQIKPDFVKLDMGLVRGVDADPYRAELVAKLIESAFNLGIRTIAEGVETEEELRWLRAHGIDFVQGYLFARPGDLPPAPKRAGKAGGRPAPEAGRRRLRSATP